MNYRHAYHAGNFADVLKHMVLVYTLHHLRKKQAPFYVLDTHAGTGLYDLKGSEAQRTLEAQEGVLALDFSAIPGIMLAELYAQAIGKYLDKNWYPGSPLLIRDLLRPQDRAQVSELHPVDANSLKDALNRHYQVQVYCQDGYQSLRAFLPPKERRGLVLIDPPFEKLDEFKSLWKNLVEAYNRFAHGLYLIWYPIKDFSAVRTFQENCQNLGKPLLTMTLQKLGKQQGLMSTGLLFINPPFGLDKALAEIKPWFKKSGLSLDLKHHP